MRATVIHAPSDVRVEELDDPRVVEPTDAVLRVVVACVCGSDLWTYRGENPLSHPVPMGHEYVGVVEEVGADVTGVRPGQLVVGSFFASDNTCAICRAGYQTSCVHRQPVRGAQAERLRVPLADGTLVAVPGYDDGALPDDDVLRGLLAASDVLGTGWFGALAAQAGPGRTVVVVGDGAVGLLAVLAAVQLGSERVVAMSRHAPRQELARAFGATDVVAERGEEGVARVLDLTDGLGAHGVVEAVGTPGATAQALGAVRPGGHVGVVGLPHGVELPVVDMFYRHVHWSGGPAPVRQLLPDLVARVLDRSIEPGRVFDLDLPLDRAAEAYAAMDERRAIKALLRP